MKIMRWGSLLLLIVLSSSCTHITPESKRPAVNLPHKWHSSDKKAQISSIKLNTLAWWEKFHDPQLNSLIAEALARNNDMGMATGNLLQAQAYLKKIQLSWLPTLSLGGLAFTGQASDFNDEVLGFNIPLQNRNSFDGYIAGFIPSYTLNLMRQLKLGKVARLNLGIREAARNAVALGVISQTAGTYFSLLGLKRQLTLQEQLIRDSNELRRYIILQYQQGAVSYERLLAIEQVIVTLQKKIPVLQHDITQAENALNVIINTSMSKVITQNNFNNISAKGIIPINLPSEVLKGRPDVAIADYQLQVKHAMVGVTASQLFPTINLTGLLGTASVDLPRLLHFGNSFALGEALAGMPLIDLSIYADIKKAKGARYTAYYNYLKTVRNAFAEVDNALSKHSTVDASYDYQAQALLKAKQQYRVSQKQYQQGMLGYSETLAAKLNVDYMEAMLNEAKMQQMNSIVNLYQVLGGGYCVS